MRSLDESRKRWRPFYSNYTTLSALKKGVKAADDTSPCVSGLRSAFLLFGDVDQASWPNRLSESRQAYAGLRKHFLQHLEHPDELELTADPLADDEASPWIVLRQDETLRAEIFQDVERCMPENAYFREAPAQKMLLDILFVFCKLNGDVGYRQGMHELLAPMLWVVGRDAIEPESAGDVEKSAGDVEESDRLLLSMLDAQYVEHDAFTLFSLVMRTAKNFYELEQPTTLPDARSPQRSPIIEQSRRIHENYLARIDPELARRLKEIDVLPQVFLIRWIRLLFGREFPFDEFLALWDVLFADDPGLDLVDLICVAMLLRVRWQLMEADYSSALTMLLRYPSPAAPHGPSTFVQDALFLRDNTTTAGGSAIISKYSGKAPGPAPAEKTPGTPSPALSPERRPLRAKSPLESPARFIQQQGGIEGLLQGAAKGVYTRGERWGVNKAMREAVGEVKKGLQSAGSSPRRSGERTRWSLDEGRDVGGDSAAALPALEARNKALAQMLGHAIDDLWAQHDGDKASEAQRAEAAEAFAVAVARLQFVQVYLEDASLALPTDEPPTIRRAEVVGPRPASPPPPAKEGGDVGRGARPSTPPPNPAAAAPWPIRPPKANTTPARPPPNHQPRSSLAQSSFAWMLGEDEPPHSSKTSTPFPAPAASGDRRGSKNSAGAAFLFGDGPDDDDDMPKSSADEGFSLGSLRGGKG
ncbi:MAG: hypothetical protein M1832_003174 [Thelocarpon impressellum]|nr:MAG: hypothetical protein M1832_003174 [Thelocarpon impressellum]